MATDAQVLANRQNAQASTGPKSPEGKARSSQNRIAHGLTGRHIVLPGEDPAEFDNLLEALWSEHQPDTPTEEILVEEMAHARWKTLRMFRRGMHQTADLDGLTKFERYEATARRAFYKALQELRRLRAGRDRETITQIKTVVAKLARLTQAIQPENGTKPISSPSTPLSAAVASPITSDSHTQRS